MFYPSTYDKATFILSLLISAIIYVLSIALNKTTSLNKVRGVVFFIPLSVLSYQFIFTNTPHFQSIILACELIICIIIITVTAISANEDYYRIGNALSYLMSPIIIYYMLHIDKLPRIFKLRSVILGLLILFTIIAIILIRNKKDSERTLFIGVFTVLLSNLIIYGFNNIYTLYIALTGKLFAYLILLMFFYGTAYKSMMSKVSEAKKLKEAMEKQLNLEIKKRTMEIERSNERLIQLANQDSLTKSYNKKAILAIIEKQLMFERNRQFSILMFDIDKFKYINDRFGHIQGDLCIKTLASITQTCIRDNDYLGRYGGDEFIVVLPALSLTEATVVAERLRYKVSQTENPQITISIGVATYPQDGRKVEELIAAADKGLYISKSKGRNSVSHYKLF